MPRNKSEKGDPPHVCPNGDKYWFRDKKIHREDGPAIEWADGEKWWFCHGELIRKEAADDSGINI